MIYSKEKYIEQSKTLVEKTNNMLTMEDFDNLYSAGIGDKKEDNNVLVEKIVNVLFQMPYMTSPIIPWEFIKSPVGEILSIVLFGMPLKIDEIIFANELADLAGVTVQHISQEIKRGNLDAYQKPNGVWLIREDEANRYLAKKRKPTIKELKAIKEQKEKY